MQHKIQLMGIDGCGMKQLADPSQAVVHFYF